MTRRRVIAGQTYIMTRRGWRMVKDGMIRTRKGWRLMRKHVRGKKGAATSDSMKPAPIEVQESPETEAGRAGEPGRISGRYDALRECGAGARS